MYGSQEPTHRVVPPSEGGHGDRAARVLSRAGLRLMPWQRLLMDDWLALGPDGSWASQSCGLSVPRQNGKTAVVSGRMAYGMVAHAEWVVYTSHLQKTSTETFEFVRDLFASAALRPYVAEVRSALGREEVILKNGGRVKFLARTRNGGRGQHGDLWVVDEAQELTDTQQGIFMPMLAASRRPQAIYLGTPPDETCPGETFRRMRADALSGTAEGVAWSEWSVPEVGDVADRSRWCACNPSLGRRMRVATVATEAKALSPDTFARERLGWWSHARVLSAIPADEWDACATDAPPSGGTVSYAVKFSADGRTGVLSACVRPDAGRPHVEVVAVRDMRAGLTWFADWIEGRAHAAASVTVDGMSNAQPLVDELLRRGVPKSLVSKPRSAEVADACSSLLNAVHERKVTHFAQPALDEAAHGTTKRSIGSGGGWGFGGEGAALMESVALAHRGAIVTRRDPRRKQRLSF